MKFKYLLTLTFFIIGIHQMLGQSAFPFFEVNSQIPKDILKTRTVVFMHVNSLNWEQEAKVIHQSLRQVGIDAVAYYSITDILSGHDATNSFYDDISSRSITSMMIIHKEKEGAYTAYMGKISADGQFFTAGMPVYKLTAQSLEKLGNQLELKINQANLPIENYLIIDVPEVFKKTNVIKTRRVADYNPDLRIDKLAVPKFEKNIMITANVDSLNAALDTVMKNNYPFQYGLVEPNLSDDELISQGYLMVIRKLENNIESLKRMLGYEIKNEETIHISTRRGKPDQLKKLFADQIGHKYYVQQLYTKDIYLGNKWDADLSWEDALINHIANLKADLKR